MDNDIDCINFQQNNNNCSDIIGMITVKINWKKLRYDFWKKLRYGFWKKLIYDLECFILQSYWAIIGKSKSTYHALLEHS